jgi:hypothetical protein
VPAISLLAISPSNVLVVYNSQRTASQAVRDYYTQKRPGVLSFDLNDSTLLPGTISYADFASKIRNPIRSHLNTNALSQQIEVLVLTKDIPHRVQNLDLAAPNAGDNPFNTYYFGDPNDPNNNGGNATFASVDSELTLLQFDLESGEANGTFDSFADNAVNNPFFDSTTAFSSFSRAGITAPDRSFYIEGTYDWWRLYSTVRQGRFTFKGIPLDAGHIYLTARLDAETVDDVKAMIDRAQDIRLRTDVDAILFDSNGRTGTNPFVDDPAPPFQLYYPLYSTLTAIDDYAEAQSALVGAWNQFIWDDDSANFLIGNSPVISSSNFIINRGPVAHLSSYGVNHGGSGSKRDYLFTYEGQLVDGASWIAYESYAAQGLGGVALSRQQGQVEEWIASGGTFAMGNVWEPYTIGIPRSAIFLDRFLNRGWTYVEAAWASMLQLSWCVVVIGDPLATANITQADAYDSWIFGQTGTTPDVDATSAFNADFETDGLFNGLEYVLGLDTTEADANSPRIPSIQGSTGNFAFQFTGADPFPENLILNVEATDDLTVADWPVIATRDSSGSWSGSATVSETTTANGTEIGISEPSLNNEPQRFYRLEVQQTP